MRAGLHSLMLLLDSLKLCISHILQEVKAKPRQLKGVILPGDCI